MTVYKDDSGYATLVAHGSDNPLRHGNFELTGLMHYCINEDRDAGSLEIFDGSNGTFYALGSGWNGVDWDAVAALIDEEGIAPDEEYYRTIELYDEVLHNALVRDSLA